MGVDIRVLESTSIPREMAQVLIAYACRKLPLAEFGDPNSRLTSCRARPAMSGICKIVTIITSCRATTLRSRGRQVPKRPHSLLMHCLTHFPECMFEDLPLGLHTLRTTYARLNAPARLSPSPYQSDPPFPSHFFTSISPTCS